MNFRSMCYCGDFYFGYWSNLEQNNSGHMTYYELTWTDIVHVVSGVFLRFRNFSISVNLTRGIFFSYFIYSPRQVK